MGVLRTVVTETVCEWGKRSGKHIIRLKPYSKPGCESLHSLGPSQILFEIFPAIIGAIFNYKT